jgi:aminocarboxymuconate-semialdehyde decarboxylase
MAQPDPAGFHGRVKNVSEMDMALLDGGSAERLPGLPAKTHSKENRKPGDFFFVDAF